MRNYVFLPLLIVTYLSCNAVVMPDAYPDGGVVLHTACDMIPSEDEVVLNSHADQERWSVLQPMYETFTIIPHEYLIGNIIKYPDQCFACYPRIKKMANGEYIMFYHGGRTGTRIWCTISTDLKKWSAPVMLYEPEPIVIDGRSDVIRYVNMDAVVLPDGEILAVCSYRASSHYDRGVGGGLKLIRSKDNGRTWSAPEIIYEGLNWEAYLLLLPDQRTIHCYFTDAIPQSRNSGTSLIISTDNGVTWSEKSRICRQYKYDYTCPVHDPAAVGAPCPPDCPKTEFLGQKIYTDQMPCFRVLNDGKTIAGFMEARLEAPTNINGSSYCKMSMVYNDGLVWEALGEPDKINITEGPSRRYTNMFKGGAGYMATFPQGEVVISYNVDSTFRMKVLDRHAGGYGGEIFTEGWIEPFTKFGYWGCLEVDTPQTLVASMNGADRKRVGAFDGIYDEDEGMQVGRFWMNRRIDAHQEAISVDGNSDEWKTRQALYLSSPDKTETIFRAAHDGKNLYLAVETAIFEVVEPHALSIGLSNTSGSAKYFVKIDSKGKVTASDSSLKSAVKSGRTRDGRSGRVTEICIPLQNIKSRPGDMICVYAKATTADSSTAFSLANQDVVSSWQRISLMNAQ